MIKPSALPLLLILLVVLPGCDTKKSCASYRTGTFEMTSPETQLDYIIERNDSIQTETNLKTGIRSAFTITWESECRYILRLSESNMEIDDFFKNRKLYIEIVEVYDEGYKFSTQFEGMEQIDYATMSVAN